jgi:hypothetical protein
MPLPNNDADFYLVIEGFGARGPSFLETDLAQADRNTIVRNFISGRRCQAAIRRMASLTIWGS